MKFYSVRAFINGFVALTPSLAFTSITVPVVENSPYTLGRGHNSVNGAVGTECVEVDHLSSNGQNDRHPEGSQILPNGQWLYRKISIAKDSAELRSSLGIDAQASFGFFGGGVDASAHYLNESRKTSNNLYVVIYSRVSNDSEVMDHFRLTQTGRDLATQNPMEFYRRCGDSFIGGRTTGGEFWHVLRIEAASATQKSEFESKIRAHGLGWNASVSLISTIDEIKSSSRVSSETFKRGGVMNLPDHDDLTANLRFANNLNNHVRSDQSNSALAFIAFDYKVVTDMPILAPALETQRRALIWLAQMSDQAYKRLQLADEVIRDPKGFIWESDPMLIPSIPNYRDQIQVLINNIEDSAEECFKNPDNCRKIEIKWPEGKLPRAKTNIDIIYEKNLIGVKLEFHTTNQELDHDSMFDVELVKISDNGHLGKYALKTDHGKKWTDWTVNNVELTIDNLSNHVVAGNMVKLLLNMYPSGNNNWNFYIIGHLLFADKRVEIFQTSTCEIKGKGSRMERRIWNLSTQRWE